jgi:hypothetical protein
MGANKRYNIHANHDIKITATSHKTFSLLVVFLELTIINKGNIQTKNITPRATRTVKTGLSML